MIPIIKHASAGEIEIGGPERRGENPHKGDDS